VGHEVRWDGGQLHVSVNGGAFTAVPANAFTQNGYNGALVNSNLSSRAGMGAFLSSR
jgi:hypothetical protein